MRKYGIILVLILVAGGAAAYYFMGDREANAAAQGQDQPRQGRQGGAGGGGGGFGGGGFGGGGFGGGGGRGGPRPPLAVELASVTRRDMIETVLVVGNLIGAASVDAVPRAQGRLVDVYVKLGDHVRQGQPIAKIEDNELVQQLKQAEATYNVSQATIRQRQADLKLAENNLERSRSLFERDLLPRQTFDDTDARYQAARAQLDLAQAQMDQAKARLEELKINLSNTVITAPVEGFIGKRTLDPGASVGVNTSFISVVDIRTVRLVVNVVEKDLRRITAGTPADVEVDAYPGENFNGHVARVAPVLDPATRTAQVEIEIANPGFRLKPGMYARVRFTVEKHEKALVVPTLAVVDVSGKIGVWLPNNETVKFQPVKTGIEQQEFTQIIEGLDENTRVISTGAGALREGDRITMAGARGGNAGRSGRGGRRGGGAAPGGGEGPAINSSQAPSAVPGGGNGAAPGRRGQQ